MGVLTDDRKGPERSWWPRHWEPPHVVAWRAIWILPAQSARVLLVVIVFLGWGAARAEDVWRATE